MVVGRQTDTVSENGSHCKNDPLSRNDYAHPTRGMLLMNLSMDARKSPMSSRFMQVFVGTNRNPAMLIPLLYDEVLDERVTDEV